VAWAVDVAGHVLGVQLPEPRAQRSHLAALRRELGVPDVPSAQPGVERSAPAQVQMQPIALAQSWQQ